MFHLKMPFCQTTKLGGPRSTPLSIITWTIPPSYYTHPPLLPTHCPTEMRHWQIFIRRPIPARACCSALFYFTDQALSQDEGFVCASLCSSPPLTSNWYICGCDNPFAPERVLLGMITTWGPCLNDNAAWSGSAADGCARGRWQKAESWNFKTTLRQVEAEGTK